MNWPSDLVLVRHGKSEANFIHHPESPHILALYKDEMRNVHSSQWRLATEGVNQIKKSGEWVNSQFGSFDAYHVSAYVRAIETAGLLNIPGAAWEMSLYLHEQDWGELESIPDAERTEEHARSLALRSSDPFFWRPPGGESMADVCLRIDEFIDRLLEYCAGKRVIAVCHGAVMMAFRMVIEQLPQSEFRRLLKISHGTELGLIGNGQIIHYSCKNPVTGETTSNPEWKRFYNPNAPAQHSGEWERIIRPTFSNEDLLRMAQSHPRRLPESI